MLGAAIPSLQATLELHRDARERTNGDAATFADAGRRSWRLQRPFDSMALWQVGSGGLPRCSTSGSASELATLPPAEVVGRARRLGARAGASTHVRGRRPARRRAAPARVRLRRARAGAALPGVRRADAGPRTARPRRQGLGVRRSRLRAVRRARSPAGQAHRVEHRRRAARRPHRLDDGAVRRHAPAARHLAPQGARRLAAGLAALDPRRVRPAVHRRRPRSRCGGSRSAATRPRGSRSRTSVSTPTSAASPRRCSTACSRRRCPRRPGSSSARSTRRGPRASTSAATGTRSWPGPTAPSWWWSATSRATVSTRRR